MKKQCRMCQSRKFVLSAKKHQMRLIENGLIYDGDCLQCRKTLRDRW